MRYLILFLICFSAHAKKFALVENDVIVHKYEAPEKIVFGGPWGKIEQIEIDESFDLDRIFYGNGKIKQRNKTQDEVAEEVKASEERALRQELRALKKNDLSDIEAVKDALIKVIKRLEK